MIVITLIGGKQESELEWILEDIGAKTVNSVNSGMFGNFSTLTYYVEFFEKDDIIIKRRELMNLISQRLPCSMALYEHGDWNRIFIMKKFRIRNNVYSRKEAALRKRGAVSLFASKTRSLMKERRVQTAGGAYGSIGC